MEAEGVEPVVVFAADWWMREQLEYV